jgi:DNA-binding transcriptional ArsR family regulator
MSDESSDYLLKGTTLRVYRCLYRAGTPLGIHDVQRALKLSSPSVAEYHIKKLVRAGLAKPEQDGYVVDRIVFENVIRIRRMVIPLQTTFVAFFASALVVLLTILRPSSITSTYVFSLVVCVVAIVVLLYEALRTLATTS